MTYFKNVNTLEELRKQYKELLKQYHPDNPNGSTEATQAINAEYDRLFKQLKNKHESKQKAPTEQKQTLTLTSTILKQMKNCVKYCRKSSTLQISILKLSVVGFG